MPQPFHQGAYPDNWQEIAWRIKSEANWTCVRCGHPHDAESGHVLTVHHFDGDKGNCQRWNLMALCQRCHLSVQARVDPRLPLMFDAAPWSMPYIAGFYAAGKGIASPIYNLEKWISEYELLIGPWPRWAPHYLTSASNEGGLR